MSTSIKALFFVTILSMVLPSVASQRRLRSAQRTWIVWHTLPHTFKKHPTRHERLTRAMRIEWARHRNHLKQEAHCAAQEEFMLISHESVKSDGHESSSKSAKLCIVQ